MASDDQPSLPDWLVSALGFLYRGQGTFTAFGRLVVNIPVTPKRWLLGTALEVTIGRAGDFEAFHSPIFPFLPPLVPTEAGEGAYLVSFGIAGQVGERSRVAFEAGLGVGNVEDFFGDPFIAGSSTVSVEAVGIPLRVASLGVGATIPREGPDGPIGRGTAVYLILEPGIRLGGSFESEVTTEYSNIGRLLFTGPEAERLANDFQRAVLRNPDQIGEIVASAEIITPFGPVTVGEVIRRTAEGDSLESVLNILPSQSEVRPRCFPSGTPIAMWDGSDRPIEAVGPGDEVVSIDARGNLVPGKVVRTFVTENQTLIDFHGTRVTPGHAFLGGDGVYRTIQDILETDGTVVRADGTVIRARTGRPATARETLHAAPGGTVGGNVAAGAIPAGAALAASDCPR